MFTRSMTKCLLAAGLTTAPLLADTSDTMVESLMKLRAEVEALHSEIEYAEDGYRTSMKSLALQKNDFEAQINRQETQLKKIDQEIAQIKEMIKKRASKTEGLNEIALSALNALESVITRGIPFKTGLRLSDVKEIRTQLEGSLITAEQAVARIWGSYDDVLRMSSENGIFKQPITLGGEQKLVDVAKLGTVMLFFMTPEGEVGYAKKEGDKYLYVTEQDPDRQEQVLVLFDALKKQIRTGYFTIPYTANTMETK